METHNNPIHPALLLIVDLLYEYGTWLEHTETAPSAELLAKDTEEAADDEPALGGSIDEDYSIEVPPETI